MPHPFDPGPVAEPFASLAADYPGSDVYPPEWASREDLLKPDAPKPKKDEAKRATVVVRVPLGERPWKPLDA